MSCRSTLLCRRTAHQTQQHIWITDDILAEAFHRYARVSLHNARLGEGRRYGSNVPGPLEARRRLAKRRMGMAALSAANASVNSGLGALFNFGFGDSTSRLSPESGWKWEAPRPQAAHRSEGAKYERSAGWAFDWPDAQQSHETWDSFLRIPETPESDSESRDYLIEESRKKMIALLETREGRDVIGREDLPDVTHFLQTPFDEPQASNMLRLFEWLASKEISPGCIQEIVNLVEHKIRLGTLNVDDISSTLAALTPSDRPEQLELLAACLNTIIVETDFESVCISITRLLSRRAEQQMHSRTTDPRIMHWLQALSSCSHMQGFHHLNRNWQRVYSTLATLYREPAPIARHLLTLRKIDLSHILLHHWVPHIMERESASLDRGSSNITYTRSHKHLIPSQSFNINHTCMENLVEDFKKLRQRRLDARGTHTRKFSSLIDLLSVLQTNQIPHTMLAQDIFEILKRARPTELFGIFRELNRHPTLGVTSDLAADLIRYFISHRQPELALLIFEAVPTLSIRRCYDLPLKLVNSSQISSARIFRMMLRQTSEDIAPCESEPAMTDPENSLLPEQIDLVYLLAHAFAKSERISDRVAFRRVWECYRFLQCRHAPISSLLTRAIVHAGVIRPLNDWKRISTMKFKWIAHIVSMVEGPEVAEALDHLVFQIWNRDIAHRMRVRGRGKTIQKLAGIRPNELNATRRRLKSWHLHGRWIDGNGPSKED